MERAKAGKKCINEELAAASGSTALHTGHKGHRGVLACTHQMLLEGTKNRGQHRPLNCGAGQAQSWAEGGLAPSRLGMAHWVSHTHSWLPEHQVLLFVPCCKCWPADL